MGIVSNFFGFIDKEKQTIIDLNGLTIDASIAESCLYELAIDEVVTILGNALSLCEFVTYEKNKRIKNSFYHLYNVRPNLNQNSSEFMKKVAKKLVYDNEVLIFQDNQGYLHVANSFSQNDMIFYEKTYSEIVLDSSVLINKTFKSSDVIHLKLDDKNMKKITEKVYALHAKNLGKLINNLYKKRGQFKIGTQTPFQDKKQEEIVEIFKSKVKSYFGNEDVSVMTIENGLEFFDKSENDVNVDDINKMIDRIYKEVFSAYMIPIDLINQTTVASTKTGYTTIDQLILLAVHPITNLFEKEINAKTYSSDDFNKGNFINIRTEKIKKLTIFDSAKNIDILRRNGYSYNEIMFFLGEPEVNEGWANDRYVTKNYEKIKD